jgi:hypothetical protein
MLARRLAVHLSRELSVHAVPAKASSSSGDVGEARSPVHRRSARLQTHKEREAGAARCMLLWQFGPDLATRAAERWRGLRRSRTSGRFRAAALNRKTQMHRSLKKKLADAAGDTRRLSDHARHPLPGQMGSKARRGYPSAVRRTRMGAGPGILLSVRPRQQPARHDALARKVSKSR